MKISIESEDSDGIKSKIDGGCVLEITAGNTGELGMLTLMEFVTHHLHKSGHGGVEASSRNQKEKIISDDFEDIRPLQCNEKDIG